MRGGLVGKALLPGEQREGVNSRAPSVPLLKSSTEVMPSGPEET